MKSDPPRFGFRIASLRETVLLQVVPLDSILGATDFSRNLFTLLTIPFREIALCSEVVCLLMAREEVR